MTGDSMKWDKTGKLGSGSISQYQHSASFLGDGILGDQLSCLQGKIQDEVATDASWGRNPLLKVWKKSPFINRHRMFFHWHTLIVMPFYFFLFESLTFAWIPLSGFQSTGSIFLFYAPNFCLDRHFGFPVHRDALYCLSHLFRFFA